MLDKISIYLSQSSVALGLDAFTGVLIILLLIFLLKSSNNGRRKVILILIFAAYCVIINTFNATLSTTILKPIFSIWPIIVFFLFGDEISQLSRKFEFHNHLRNSQTDNSHVVRTLVGSIEKLSRNKTGALIVFEGSQSLEALTDKGISIDGEITDEMIMTIFNTSTPMHDGAVVIRNGRIVSAGVFFQPSIDPNISKQLGSRHRAAIGAAELYDALIIVVSEETGKISIARNSKLERNIDSETLYQYMIEYL